MIYDSRENDRIFNRFAEGRNFLEGVTIEIVNGENELDARTLLRAQEAEANVDNTMALAASFIKGKEVRFFDAENKIIHSFIYNGGDLADKFAGKPYLLDLLLKMAFGLLIKKLTPPSVDSEN